LNLENREDLEALCVREKFEAVCHLAAQAGVRYSLTNPHAYAESNLNGFLNILEAARKSGIQNLCYASSSSVYGLNTRQPFSTKDTVDHPVSLYAATKKANELMAHAYSHLYGIPATGLRFFTVYGPWGRPDMAYFLFTKAVLEGKPITINNFGDMKRDFTYIDDIVEGIIRVIDKPARPNPDWNPGNPDPASSPAPWRIYNIGRGSPVGLMELVEAVEAETGKKAEKILQPMPAGDVHTTWADTQDLEKDFGYTPRVDIRTGIGRFVRWYQKMYLT
jgi:UDP-glucuronate 4-epimerase